MQYTPGSPPSSYPFTWCGYDVYVPIVQLAVIVTNGTVYIMPSGQLTKDYYNYPVLPGLPSCAPTSLSDFQGCLLLDQTTGPCGCLGSSGTTRQLIPLPPYDLCSNAAIQLNDGAEAALSYQINSNAVCPTGGISGVFCDGPVQGYSLPSDADCDCQSGDPFYGSDPP